MNKTELRGAVKAMLIHHKNFLLTAWAGSQFVMIFYGE